MKVKRSLLAMLALGMILCGCVDTPNEEHVSDTTTTTAPDLDAHYAYTQEELFVERGENQIYGILYLPQDVQGPLPAVIYAHGYDVYEDIGDYTKDVLILHGDADTIVPLLFKACTGRLRSCRAPRTARQRAWLLWRRPAGSDRRHPVLSAGQL